jgi:LmbE family N-acetylglucosaminyl deacetylase
MKISYKIFWMVLCLGFVTTAIAQKPEKPNAAEIYHSIQKLNFLGSALYVAAHPDDENTRLIAYLANEVKANTAYLSLTRGDGGQNLVGPEIRELLGVIRTQELLAARRTDGGSQMFSRANDFGYSKHPDETLKIWNEKEVMADVIWAIRKWQPDIIVNRFDHRTPGRTHGHHTASAMLSEQAFNMAGNRSVYPEQLRWVGEWQPRRQFFNTSWWFYGSRENFAKADKSKMISVDIGVYYPLLGQSNTEIAAASRSMHKSQGFGSTGTRGSQSEYLELINGDLPEDKENLFDGINTTWTRVKGGEEIGKILKAVEDNYNFSDPAASVPELVKAYKLIKQLPDGYWKRVKQQEVEEVISSCMALYVEVVADDYSATPGEDVELSFEVINRSNIPAQLWKAYIPGVRFDTTLNLDLDDNQSYKFYKKITIPKNIGTTISYWLNKKWELGMYTVEDQLQRGLPETPRQIKVMFTFNIDGEGMVLTKDVVFKRNDPVEAEVYRPFEITPPIFTNLNEKIYVYADGKPQEIEVLVKSGKPNVSGTLELCYSEGWKAEPANIDFELKRKGEEQKFTFTLYPPKEQSEDFIVPLAKVDGKSYTNELIVIEYDHIPTQTVVRDASAKVVNIDLKKAGQRIGYIMGAGDDIPSSLEQMGYQVTILEDKDITTGNLAAFDAVVMGVRAYNTIDRLKFQQDKLMEYVKNGGTMLVQYNTSHRLKVPAAELGPYPLKLSRDRVSVEEAEVRFLKPDHEVLNWPNKITQKDFEGWVQERGLYFPNEWDDQYEAILSANDPGEPARDGGLLVAKYGKGHYIYSGYSWFRELPAGVPGAYRIFANLVSIGKRP